MPGMNGTDGKGRTEAVSTTTQYSLQSKDTQGYVYLELHPSASLS